MSEMRTCRKCGAVKSLDDFYPVYGTPYHRRECKRCHQDRMRPYVDRWQAEYRDQYLAFQREYRRQKRAEAKP